MLPLLRSPLLPLLRSPLLPLLRSPSLPRRQHGVDDELHHVVGLVALFFERRQDLGAHGSALRPHRPLRRRHHPLILHAGAPKSQLRRVVGSAHAHPLRGGPRTRDRRWGLREPRPRMRGLQVRRSRRDPPCRTRRVSLEGATPPRRLVRRLRELVAPEPKSTKGGTSGDTGTGTRPPPHGQPVTRTNGRTRDHTTQLLPTSCRPREIITATVMAMKHVAKPPQNKKEHPMSPPVASPHSDATHESCLCNTAATRTRKPRTIHPSIPHAMTQTPQSNTAVAHP